MWEIKNLSSIFIIMLFIIIIIIIIIIILSLCQYSKIVGIIHIFKDEEIRDVKSLT